MQNDKDTWKDLLKKINEFLKEVWTSEQYVENSTLEIQNMWANINYRYAYNRYHEHSNCLWAGIYYVQAEGTGNLMFYNPANTLQQCNPNSPFIRKTGIIPKDGMLILWPGWVPHEVEENKSNQQRINLAWGINFK